MKQELNALFILQAIDTELAEAGKALAALDGGAALKQGLVTTEAILATRTAALRKSEAELKDNELKLKSMESKKADFEKRLYEGKVTNPKELSSIQQEIAMIKKSTEKLDEKILELYDVIEQHNKTVKEAQDRKQQFQTRLEQVVKLHQTKSIALKADIERLSADREKAGARIPAPLLKKYESIRSRSGGLGIALVDHNRCSACHTGITPYTQRLLREDTDEYPMCESCGRFLYSDT